MNDSTQPENVTSNGENTTLAALRLAEERACGSYLTARKAQVCLGARLVSLHELAKEQPGRADYGAALAELVQYYLAAKRRTRRAHCAYRAAQLRYDAAWTDSEGRKPRLAVA